MSSQNTANGPEASIPEKLMNGYIDQVDRVGPFLVRSAEDYRRLAESVIGSVRKGMLGALDRTRYKPPFIHTVSDVSSGALSALLSLQCKIVEAGVRAHRRVAVSVRDAMSGKTAG